MIIQTKKENVFFSWILTCTWGAKEDGNTHTQTCPGKILLHKLWLVEVWTFVSPLYQEWVFPKACRVTNCPLVMNLLVFSACHFQVNAPWYKIFKLKLSVSNELDFLELAQLQSCTDLVWGLELGKHIKSPTTAFSPRLRPTNTDWKHSARHWGVQVQIKHGYCLQRANSLWER